MFGLFYITFVAENERVNIRQRQREGIEAAKARGVRFGRSPMPLPENFHRVFQKWKHGEITAAEAARVCGMPRTSFYYRAYGYEQGEVYHREHRDSG